MRDLTLIRKNLFRKPLRFILLFVVIAVAFLLYGLLGSVQVVFSGEAGTANLNRLVISNKISYVQPLPLAYLERVRAIDGVASATHTSWFGAYYQNPRNVLVGFAVDPVSYLATYPELQLSPQEREHFLSERTGLIVGKKTADKFGWKVGQRVPILSNIYSKTDGSRSWDFLITGIYTSANQSGDMQSLLFHYDYFNETRYFGRDKIATIVLTTNDPALNDSLADLIDTKFANSGDETTTVSEKQFATAFLAQFGNIGLIVTLVVGAAFVTILLVVGNTMVMAVRDRTREIGILKTLGFSSIRILRMVICESILLALSGGIAGMLLAWCAITVLSDSGKFSGLSMPFSVWWTGLSAALVLGLLTAAIPGWKALQLNIVTALGRT
ncbi:MAG: FtsX-like permease family protein [Pseudomonadota bacterium]